MSVQPPDLRLLAYLLARHFKVPEEQCLRLKTCPEHSLALVILRVVVSESKRLGLLTQQTETAILRAATPVFDPVAAMSTPVDPASTTMVSLDSVVRSIDSALSSPTTRVRFPRWFVDDFWPGLLASIASGESMTEREQMIIRRILDEVTGDAS